jgi:hypothetical protein
VTDAEPLTETEKILLSALIRGQTNLLQAYLDEHASEHWVKGRIADYEKIVHKLELPPPLDIVVRKFSDTTDWIGMTVGRADERGET